MKWGVRTPLGKESGLHTANRPYCNNRACWCHTDVSYHLRVQYPTYERTQARQAARFYGVKQERRATR